MILAHGIVTKLIHKSITKSKYKKLTKIFTLITYSGAYINLNFYLLLLTFCLLLLTLHLYRLSGPNG